MGSFPLVSFQIQLDINQLVLLVSSYVCSSHHRVPKVTHHHSGYIFHLVLTAQWSESLQQERTPGGVQGQYKLYPVTKATPGVGSSSWLSDTCGGSYAQELICDQLRRKTWEKRLKFNFRKKVFRLLNPTIVFPGLPHPTPKKASCSIYTKILKIIFTVNIKLDHR